MAQRKFLRTFALLALLAVLASPLAACGKKGPPGVPDGEQDQYPRTYPSR